jgi:ferredoxin-NADP reductase
VAYFSETGPRLDVDALLRDAPAGALIYVCGPARLIDAVRIAAGKVGIAGSVRSERFAPEHRDSALTAVERGRAGLMCTCVSRAGTPDLVLDL